MTEKIIVTGDWHGNAHWGRQVVRMAQSLGIRHIIQCGDFGLWDHTSAGIDYLDAVNAACRESGVAVHWLDGNHENHDRLAWYKQNNPADSHGHVYIRSHILYIPRGKKWSWGGKTFCAVGGAYSIDKQWRTPGVSWWSGEQLTDHEIKTKVPEGPIHFLFTHDCPTNAPFRVRMKNDPDSYIHRQRMDEVGKKVQPKLWFHGHMHEQYDYDFRHRAGIAQVYGLEMDGDHFNWGVLDVPNESFTWGVHYNENR